MIIDSDDCNFRILGPVQVSTSAGPVEFARRQQLDLLALLLLNADRVLPVSQIVDAMWGDRVPRTASTQIKNMVSALRGALVDGHQPLVTLDRHPAGYRLRISHGQLDVARFEALVAAARAADGPDAVAHKLRRALGLWQGAHALAGVRAVFVPTARAHLEEQRSTALEVLFDAELDRGKHAEIVAELTDAVADHPGRERLVGQLMTALYRSGRPTDALAAYRKARHTLAEEYGLEPGPMLRDLERQILVGDVALSAPPEVRSAASGTASTAASGRAATPVPAQLPPDVRGFAGRLAELARLDALVPAMEREPKTVVISAVMGTAGVGKTALAVHWAHQVVSRFPDGQLYVNLRGFDPGGAAVSPSEAVRGFLDALGVPPERIPSGLDAQAALYRSLIAGRLVLVVLDNAVSAEQVRPLLPGTPGCLVVVTSRNRLLGLVGAEGAYPMTLDLMTPAEARELLTARLGRDRIAAEADAADAIAAQCARLPLALAMVAARAAINPTFPLAALSAELSSHDSGTDVHTVFSWSYEQLGAPAARLFRLLGLHPGPHLAAPAAASLAGAPVPHARALLVELANAHLIAEHSPGRFSIHDLLRGYAGELAQRVDPDGERRSAVRRMLDYYLQTANRAALHLHPHRYQVELLAPDPYAVTDDFDGHRRALDWFTVEHPVLVAAVEQAAAADLGTHAWQLASTIAPFLDRRGHWDDWAGTQYAALVCAERVGDRVGQAHAHSGLGLAHARRRDYELAHTHLRRALDLLRQLDDPIGLAYTHLRMSSVHERPGGYEDALHHAEEALALYRAAGHRAGSAQALNNVGWYHAQLGDAPAAIVHCEQSVALHRELGDRQGTGHALDSLGYAYHRRGDHERAAAYYAESAEILRETGDRYFAAIALTHLGDTYCDAGEPHRARDAWRTARQILQELGHPDAEQLDAKLRAVTSPLYAARVNMRVRSA